MLLTRLSKLSDGFVGAEIEQAVIASLYEAFFHQRDLQVEDLETAIRSTVPISVTQKERIKQLRDWANVRAVSATPREDLQLYKNEDDDSDDKENINSNRGGRMLDF